MKTQLRQEPSLTLRATGGTAVFDPTSLPDGQAWVSAPITVPSNPLIGTRPALFNVRAVVKATSAPAPSKTVDVYLATSDGTSTDGSVSTGVISADVANVTANLVKIGTLTASSTGGVNLVGSWDIVITSPVIRIVMVNHLGVSFSSTVNLTNVVVTPYTEQS